MSVKKDAKKDKKTKNPEAVRFFTENVPDQFVFYVGDGTVLKNLKETVKALRKMKDETFSSHVNRDKNDFANWITDVMGYHDLAYNIIGKSRTAAADEIVNYISKKAGKKVVV
jgi:hypothetical protein